MTAEVQSRFVATAVRASGGGYFPAVRDEETGECDVLKSRWCATEADAIVEAMAAIGGFQDDEDE